MALSPDFADRLAAALRLRQLDHGFHLIAAAESEIGELAPKASDATRVLLLLAQWIDVGYRDHRIIDKILERFPRTCRRTMSVEDHLRLSMVEGFHHLAAGQSDAAIERLDLVLRILREFPNPAYAALAHFWIGRAHRKKGEYEKSLEHIVQARQMADANRDDVFTAVIQIHESWLLFQKGLSREALQTLDRAEMVLKLTDHFVALGNIESARGRIVRRSGEYAKALEHFSRAIALYSRRDPKHVNVARTLVNGAYVRRLLALQLRKRIDERARPRRNRAATAIPHSSEQEKPFTRYQRLWSDAVEALGKARHIYALHANSDGIGKVLLNLGYLHLDRGDIECAAEEGAEAYQTGVKQEDHILMARSRILQVAIENAHVEEQTGGDVDVAAHANHARQYSEEALSLAEATQNHRLHAAACISRGMTAANEFFQDWEMARRYATEATSLIGPSESDHLVEDLALLKSRIVQASGINDMLRSWSEGIVGNKSFQQITEEFAEIVIPKVWLRQDRKISRVAAALSVSPKKVRRILRNSGHDVSQKLYPPG